MSIDLRKFSQIFKKNSMHSFKVHFFRRIVVLFIPLGIFLEHGLRASGIHSSASYPSFVEMSVPISTLPKTFHPGLSMTQSDRWIMQSLYMGLLQWAHPAKIVPGSCIAWEQKGTKKWILTLSDTMYWSNGDLVTSDDFIKTWEKLAKCQLPKDHPLVVLGLIAPASSFLGFKRQQKLINVSAPRFDRLVFKTAKPLLSSLVLSALADERLAPIHASIRHLPSENQFIFAPTNGKFFIESYLPGKFIKTAPNPYFSPIDLPLFPFSEEPSAFRKIQTFPRSKKKSVPLVFYSPFSEKRSAIAPACDEMTMLSAQMLSLRWTPEQSFDQRFCDLSQAVALLLDRTCLPLRSNQLNYSLSSVSLLPSNQNFVPLLPRWMAWSSEKRAQAAVELLRPYQWAPEISPLHLRIFCQNPQEELFLQQLFAALVEKQWITLEIIVGDHHPENKKDLEQKTFNDPNALTLNLQLHPSNLPTWSPEGQFSIELHYLKKHLNHPEYFQYLETLEDIEFPGDFSDLRCQGYRELEALVYRTQMFIPIAQAQRTYQWSAGIGKLDHPLQNQWLLSDPNGFFNWEMLNFFYAKYAPQCFLAPSFIDESEFEKEISS